MTKNALIVGVDASSASAAAQTEAARIATAQDLTIVAVHCVPPLEEIFGVTPTFDQAAWQTELRRRLDDDWCHPLHAADIDFTCQIMHFNVAEGLLLAAKKSNANLIVVGLHPHGIFGGGRSHVVGHLLQHSRVPVLVVPDGHDPYTDSGYVTDDL